MGGMRGREIAVKKNIVQRTTIPNNAMGQRGEIR
jgi:hypothetical protein